MFGQKPAFGAAAPAASSAFGASTAFGAPAAASTSFGAGTSAFGAPASSVAAPAFGGAGTSAFGAAAPAAGGGLFGSAQPAAGAAGGGLFGQPAAASTSFGAAAGGGAFGGASTAFGSSAFGKPAASVAPSFGGFGAPAAASTASGGGLFGTPASTTATTGGLFGQASTTFGGAAGGAFGAGSAFGAAGTAAAPVGTTVKFNPPTGTDTMMKSGVTTNINTRHQCITCMKEYESKSLEELRCEDYVAGRKGGAAGATGAAGGLFGAPPNQVAPGAGGFFGSTATSTSGSLFGQQNKPLGFGGTTGFGATSSAAAPFGATSSFGAAATSTAGGGGLFGSKPAATGFGAPATSTATGFGGFGQQQTTGLFGQQQQQKPTSLFGGATTQQPGGLFGASTAANPGFGGAATQAAPAFGAPAAGATGGAFGFGGQSAQQSTGLFGAQAQKPAFSGFGASTTTSTATPAFGGGFGAPATQAGLFGQAAKPAFTGFGAPTSAPSFGGGFGGFGGQTQTSAAGGGLFGAAAGAAKPTLSFGGTMTQPAAAPAFGGFGAPAAGAAGGGLFGSTATQAKPGGLFGGTTGGFGAGTGAFGGTSTTGFGGGLGTLGAPAAGGGMFGASAAQQQSASVNPIQQQLAQLASSPYGDNPLFKNLSDSGGGSTREDILKPINPAAQRALESSQYKISPSGRSVKPRPKPRQSIGGRGGGLGIFEGLEDDDINVAATSGSDESGSPFVPRSSVKKLVLKLSLKSPRSQTQKDNEDANAADSSAVASPNTGSDTPAQMSIVDQSQNKSAADESLNLPPVRSVANKSGGGGEATGNNISIVDDSFAVLNPHKHKKSPASGRAREGSSAKTGGAETSPTTAEASLASTEEFDPDDMAGPADVTLKRAGYYTIPKLADLSAYVEESTGNCPVENFTIGREGYGNVFFPGVTNVAGLNLDEIVFIRHKEVIVYPDDSKKPPLGEGLNRPAQITLDKVWPVDKTSKESIRDPDQLAEVGYEDKLRKACIRLGARFVEYRAETGSWVFKVGHFSKYGLEDEDEEDDVADAKAANKDAKRIKTLQLRTDATKQQQQVPKPAGIQKLGEGSVMTTSATVHAEDLPPSADRPSPSGLSSARAATTTQMSSNKVQLMKASLFGGDDDQENTEPMEQQQPGGKPKPVILQARPTVLERRRDPLVADIAHSMLTGGGSRGGSGRGLGGTFSASGAPPPPPTLASSLLRTHFLAQRGGRSKIFDVSKEAFAFLDEDRRREEEKAKAKARAPDYSLHAGYENFVVLSGPGPKDGSRMAIPKCYQMMPPLEKSLFSGRLKCLADAALSHSRRFRVGWAANWVLANPATPTSEAHVGMTVDTIRVTPSGSGDEHQLRLLESWLELSLEFSSVELELVDIADGAQDVVPRIAPVPGLDSLHAHASEAAKQVSDAGSAPPSFGRALKEWKRTWDLCVALWGRLEEQDLFSYGGDSHEVTMLRREALSAWLEEVVAPQAEEAVKDAVLAGDAVDEMLALLSGNKFAEACQRAQENGDHYASLLMSISGGANSEKGQLLLQQMERWQETRADEFIRENRLRLYATLAGVPVWQRGGDRGDVNVCEGLDWKRAFGQHLWHLTSPVASVGDAFLGYEESFQGDSSYAEPPTPDYFDPTDPYMTTSDVKFNLLKLYTDRSHPVETVVDPFTHTADALDFRLSWLLAQVLLSLGYVHMDTAKRDLLHCSFAAQLSSLGLWHWSIFVLLHLSDAALRRQKVVDALCQNVRLKDEDSSDREEFIREHLKVPAAWIAEAKSVRARSEFNPGDRAFYLIRAGHFREAHQVVMHQIAPDAIANDDPAFLRDLLAEMARPEAAKLIPDWHLNGETLLDFLTVDAEVKSLLERHRASEDEDGMEEDGSGEELGYQIEKLRPQVTSLCGRVKSLPSSTARERLCQSEVAKRIALLMKALHKLDGSDRQPKQARLLSQQLLQLPLPDDHNLAELRQLARNYMLETIQD